MSTRGRLTRYIWGTTPSGFAKELLALVPRGGRILDLGCGEGRDSVYFASYGFAVTGLEVSGAGLEKAERLAAERGVTIRWVCRSMLDLPVTGRFDLIYSCGSIHDVPKEDCHHLSGASRRSPGRAASTRTSSSPIRSCT